MANFARACLDKFTETVDLLKEELGQGTTNLGLRTGLHSGPVTAGVLRGERARFQLFGDSVNTTARIESLGAPGRIHLSEETAKELKKFDKQDWLIPRADQVEAKGKGKLTTFWLTIGDADDTSRTTQFTDEHNSATLTKLPMKPASDFHEKAQFTNEQNGAIPTDLPMKPTSDFLETQSSQFLDENNGATPTDSPKKQTNDFYFY